MKQKKKEKLEEEKEEEKSFFLLFSLSLSPSLFSFSVPSSKWCSRLRAVLVSQERKLTTSSVSNNHHFIYLSPCIRIGSAGITFERLVSIGLSGEKARLAAEFRFGKAEARD